MVRDGLSRNPPIENDRPIERPTRRPREGIEACEVLTGFTPPPDTVGSRSGET